MALPIKVRVHPFVLFGIVDAHEHRPKTLASKQNKEPERRAVGTLFGTIDRDSYTVTNCVPINFYERDQQGKENAQMDVTTNAYMTKMMEATSPNELPIGWFSTSSHYDSNDVLGLYEYFFKLVNAGVRSAEQTHKIQPILLTMQCAELESGHGLQPKALLRVQSGVTANRIHSYSFQQLPLEITPYRPERVAVELLSTDLEREEKEKRMKGKHRESERHEKRVVRLNDGVSELRTSIDDMIRWIEKIRAYVENVVKGEQPADADLGRRLMDIVMAPVGRLGVKELDKVVTGAIKDQLMVAYLSQVAETQMTIYEKMIETVI